MSFSSQENKTAKESLGARLRENINKLMDECRINMSQLSRNTAVPITTIQRMKNEDDSNPTISTLKPIADFFNISVNQLIGDEPLPVNRIAGAFVERKESWRRIPVLTWEDVQEFPNNSPKDSRFITTDAELSENAYALQVTEENWEGFLSGSMLIIDFNLKPEDRDYVIAYKTGQAKATLKQIIHYEESTYLKPPNREFKMAVMDKTYKILGVLVQTRRDR